MPSTSANESIRVGPILEMHHLEAAAVIPLPAPHHPTPSLPQTTVPDDQQLVSIALVLISIQVQILMSASMASATVPRTILACGIVFELFGVLVSLLSPYQGHFTLSFYIVRAALTFPIIVGVLGLATTTIMIVVNISLAAAIAIACTFVSGIIVCLSLLWFSLRQ